MRKTGSKIVAIRAYVVEGGGGDYHDQGQEHWIVQQVSTPMSIYPEYKETRTSFGINALKTIVVEVEAENGVVGFGISTGGYPAAWLIMNHLDRFIVGQNVENVEKMWDQMYRASMYYGRKGIVMNAISAVDLALWDLLGRLRQEPVYAMIGGKVREELVFYATGPRPDLAKEMGFIGGKLPLTYGPADGEEGLKKNIERATEMRNRVGDDFWLMWDCWMSLDLPYAQKLMEKSEELGFKWVEECFNPDDYWSYRDLKKRAGNNIMVTGGEHEATRYGFRLLMEYCDIDIIQPDVGWCGGLTELIKIGNLAESYGKLVVPHGSGVYSYHYVTTKVNSPFTEYLVMSPKADHIVPQFYPLIIDEPIPVNGKLKVSDAPGFGVELNREAGLVEVVKGQKL
ncbi:L-rhamnonate dehydratase [Priestia endophytica]|uniref:L-rhamnonate dehydratase n=1 Tax=Priestia endophytica TaxID=135735 RepID=A0AAX1QCB0_9BACI|nr:L-rhamnonate dehydratase [Priestia endophytica]MBG9813726.1 rhamnonate dehydratase [Priestia endophytica]RAS78703.1 L-rhamnonate dehydratase [Priestia endophytica]RAS85434.1 L-rhamnonate dehydratase [Priestia endophytica]